MNVFYNIEYIKTPEVVSAYDKGFLFHLEKKRKKRKKGLIVQLTWHSCNDLFSCWFIGGFHLCYK